MTGIVLFVIGLAVALGLLVFLAIDQLLNFGDYDVVEHDLEKRWIPSPMYTSTFKYPPNRGGNAAQRRKARRAAERQRAL